MLEVAVRLGKSTENMEGSAMRLAQRLHKYCILHYGPKEVKPKETPPVKETWQVKPFSEIMSNDGLLAQFRSRLALAKNLVDLVTDPPTVLIDEKQNLFFYQGAMVHLAPATFKLMALLAKRPGEVVTKDEIYAHLWPDFTNPGTSSNPYDRQISDHKRKITTQIQKGLEGKIETSPKKIKNLVKTVRKVGYVLNFKREGVFFLA
ncbi:MAG: winged helix-turn-helix domain-containing protein [Pseudomonadota bacterium]